MVLATDIGPVLQQQILGAFKDLFMLGGRLAAFAGSDFVDNAAKGGHDMELVKDDEGLRQFFLTALMYGSHMSIATASIFLRWPALNLLKNRFNVLALRFLPTKRTRPLIKSSTTVR